MRRRDFIAFAGAAAIGTPLVARAQEERVRHLGVLINLPEGDPEGERRVNALLKALHTLGWLEGKNLNITYRWGPDSQLILKNAADLVAAAPDLIFANAPPSVLALQRATQAVPIVFAAVTDPVALGIVRSLAKPGGNATGFSPAELDISGKWLELLKEISPSIKRVGVFEESSNPGAGEQVKIIAAGATAIGVELTYIGVRERSAIDRDVAAFAASGTGGLIVLRTSEDIAARNDIIAAAARYHLPAVYPLRFCVTDGGLISYGPDIVEEYREAAGYIDRILKGEKAGELPVQQSAKFELAINLKTARALDIAIPPTLLATADEVIE